MTRTPVQGDSGSPSPNQNQDQSQPSASSPPQSSTEEEQEREMVQEPGGLDELIESLPESSRGVKRTRIWFTGILDSKKPDIDVTVDAKKNMKADDSGGLGNAGRGDSSEDEGYDGADEQSLGITSYKDVEREFEIKIRQGKGLEVKRMMEDGNCLFRAAADQVYGDPEAYDMVRQMCVEYMEREVFNFEPFMIEGIASYCERKRQDKVYGSNLEIKAFCEMYDRPVHIYSYSTEPINIFHGSNSADIPPIMLSYHRGNHYNSLVDPQRMTVGVNLASSSLQGGLLAEAHFYSDLELTHKQIKHMVMEVSRAENLAEENLNQQLDDLKQQLASMESSTSGAEPSSSGASI